MPGQEKPGPPAEEPSLLDQPLMRLNDGHLMPMLGLGTWNAHGKQLTEAVRLAIRAGYRHLDTASNYRNEAAVGEAIRDCIEAGLVRREQLFVTTKLWNNSHSRASVLPALRRSLAELQLDYVDLYLVHYPVGYQEGGELSPLDPRSGRPLTSEVDYLETWQGMEEARLAGLARSIGLSNFSGPQVERLVAACRLLPAVNQVECHPYLNQASLARCCLKHNIALTAYSPLGSPGHLGQQAGAPSLLEEPLVRKLAHRHRCQPAHVLIRFQLDRNVAAIPKSLQAAHIISNLRALQLRLAPDELAALEALERNHRFMRFERCLGHKFYPFTD